MDQLRPPDWFTLVSFVVAVLSLLGNFVQWRKQKLLEADITRRTITGMNAGYQPLWRIAELCDRARGARASTADSGELASGAFETIQEITGCVDTGRAVMNSICRDLVGSRLHYEAPWTAQAFVVEQETGGRSS